MRWRRGTESLSAVLLTVTCRPASLSKVDESLRSMHGRQRREIGEEPDSRHVASRCFSTSTAGEGGIRVQSSTFFRGHERPANGPDIASRAARVGGEWNLSLTQQIASNRDSRASLIPSRTWPTTRLLEKLRVIRARPQNRHASIALRVRHTATFPNYSRGPLRALDRRWSLWSRYRPHRLVGSSRKIRPSRGLQP
ncbi:unnamed protein product [Scytosiphon promiscuus]